MLKKITSFFIVTLMLSACAADGSSAIQKREMGAVGGAVIGGVLGSNVGGGKGQLLATGAGTLLGALVGSSIGASLDKADKAYASQAFQRSQNAPVGETITWSNPESGNRGSYTPVRQGRTQDNRVCRQYEQTIVVDGRAETGVGTACQNYDGTWEIVSN